jgi:hypothetical protein
MEGARRIIGGARGIPSLMLDGARSLEGWGSLRCGGISFLGAGDAAIRIGVPLRACAGSTGADALHRVSVAAQDGEEVFGCHVLAAVVLANALVNVLPRRLAGHPHGTSLWACDNFAAESVQYALLCLVGF